jgi:hypothetical protein
VTISRLGIIASRLVACFAAKGWAEISTDEAKRLREASTVVHEIRHAPDGGIPEDLWNRAECVAVIPSLKKGAFIFGGEYGKGVLTCRNRASWSVPAFIELRSRPRVPTHRDRVPRTHAKTSPDGASARGALFTELLCLPRNPPGDEIANAVGLAL